MRRIRNVAFAFLVLSSMVKVGEANLRADYYFDNCFSVTYNGACEVTLFNCQTECEWLEYDCWNYCLGQNSTWFSFSGDNCENPGFSGGTCYCEC